MAMDGLMIAGVVRHLDVLIQSKISKIQNLSEDEIVFTLHGRKTYRLVINTHSNTNRIYLADFAREFLPVPENFVMVLRKYLSQGVITEIEQAGFDRLIKIKVRAHNELGDWADYILYVELMGKYSNLVLVGEDGIIIDASKRIPVYENSKRLIHPGALYTLPEKQPKQSPLENPHIDLERSLVGQVEGFSPLLSDEYIYRMKKNESFESITNELLNSDTLYVYGKNSHLLEMKHLGQADQTWPLMKGLNDLYIEQEKKDRIQKQCGDVFKAVDKEKKKLEKKLPKLLDTLEQSKNYQIYQKWGDLLFAWMHEIEKAPVVTVPDFETGADTEIPIDMRYDLKTNANLYYKKYHKQKRSLEYLEKQIENTREGIEYFSLLASQLPFCSIEDALEIREELIKNRILLVRKNPVRKKKSSVPHILKIVLDDCEIYVGKNNLQNDYITHKLSRKQDLWFHVKDYHGSHVLLKSEAPNEEQIRLCAMLAAWFSKSRDSSSVPVDYTQIKNLKKIPASKMGLVSMKTYKTIYIDPDKEQIEQILKTRVRKS